MVPAVVLVLALCMAGMQLSAQHLRLQDAASAAARSAGRGESLAAADRIVPGASLRTEHDGDLVCITATVVGSSVRGVLGAFPISATGCALQEQG